MNIKTNNAGCVSQEYIESQGFTVFDIVEINDMGQCTVELPKWTNGKIDITGGWWCYYILDSCTKEKLWEGWWNSNEEFDETIKNIINE